MNIPGKLAIAAVLLTLCAGPAYPQNKDIVRLQVDMVNMQQQLKQLQNTIDENNAVMKGLVERMADQVNTLSGGMQKVTQAVDGMRTQTDSTAREIRGSIANLNTTIGEMQKDLSTARAQVNSLSQQVTALKTTAEPLAGPDDLWRAAYLDSLTGSYNLAISGYQEFLSKYPDDPRAAEAHFMIGEALSAQKKYDQALQEYDIVLQKYPESDRTRSALYKKGLALAEQNQPQQAISVLNDVVKRFPGTSEAANAQAKVRDLQRPPAQRTPARQGGGR